MPPARPLPWDKASLARLTGSTTSTGEKGGDGNGLANLTTRRQRSEAQQGSARFIDALPSRDHTQVRGGGPAIVPIRWSGSVKSYRTNAQSFISVLTGLFFWIENYSQINPSSYTTVARLRLPRRHPTPDSRSRRSEVRRRSDLRRDGRRERLRALYLQCLQ